MGRSRDGGVEPRGVRRYAAARQPQAPRTVDTQRLTHRAQDVNTVKTLGRPPCACAAEAQQALAICAHSVPATFVAQSPVRPPPTRCQAGAPTPR